MKPILSFPFIVLSLQLSAQNPIPNPGFENWQFTPMFTIEADGWQSNNSEIAAWNVIPDSDVYAGSLALNLVYNSYRGTITAGFPITSHPDYLSGYVKNLMSSPSEAWISIVLFHSGIPVDSGNMIFYGGPIILNYHPFSIPISHTTFQADSAAIVIMGGSENQSSISFDELSFDTPSGIPDFDQVKSNAGFYPNPAHGSLVIPYYDGTPYTATLLNMSGQIVDVIPGLGHPFNMPLVMTFLAIKQVEIDTRDLPSGIYFLHIRSQINDVTQRIVYEK